MQSLETSIRRFEDKYAHTAATTADEVSAWFSQRFGDYAIVPLKSSESGQAVTLSNAGFSDFHITFTRWGFSTEGTSLADSRSYCLGIPLTGSSVVFDPHFGRVACKKNQARIFRRDSGTGVTASAGTDILNLAIPSSLLEARAQSYFDRKLNDPLRFSPVIDFDTTHGAAIVNLINHMLTMLTIADEAFQHEILRTNYSEHLIATVLGVLPHNYGDQPAVPIDSCAPRSVRRAEEWMRAHAHEPITMEQLAIEAGCSERALQNAFRSFCNKTPMSVLRDIRLEGAHADLMQGGARVADIAFKWGFSNLGRFAAQYEARYQQKPSQTAKELAA